MRSVSHLLNIHGMHEFPIPCTDLWMCKRVNIVLRHWEASDNETETETETQQDSHQHREKGRQGAVKTRDKQSSGQKGDGGGGKRERKRQTDRWTDGQRQTDRGIYLFIYWRLIAQSTTQGHLRAFHKFKSSTSWIQYKSCALHKHKTYKHKSKVSPFGIALVKYGK